MAVDRTMDELIAEGSAVPVEGWDFGWFAGRATEQRPPWGYLGLVSERMARASRALDLQTGGGEVLAQIGRPPASLTATEAWPPNLEIARRNLRRLGASVVAAADRGALPFAAQRFDLIVSRHPITTDWAELARVLVPGGSYLSQQVGVGSVRELTDAIMGPQLVSQSRSTERAVAEAERAGLRVVDLRQVGLRMEFHDIGAVVHFLRKVIWTVPDFTVDRYRAELAAVHEQIQSDGAFVAYSQRFLIEAVKPG